MRPVNRPKFATPSRIEAAGGHVDVLGLDLEFEATPGEAHVTAASNRAEPTP